MSLRSNDGDTVATEDHSDFSLHWTVGFAGKRMIAPAREPVVRAAVSRALDALLMKAVRQGASLTAVSSVARGGDLIFAETALGKDHRRKWPWKCVLPFSLEPFLDNDLGDLQEPERTALRRRATDCVRAATTPPIVTSPGTDVHERAQREESYLDCGYRVVDEADVVIVLLTGQEMAECDKTLDSSRALAGPGSAAVARYAIAARHPTILFDADAPDPWDARRIYNDPEAKPVPEEFFHDDLAAALVTIFSPVWRASHFVEAFRYPLEALIIIAPFVAAYSLATMSLLDCRRRERRYDEMSSFLERTRDTLGRTESNASRLRLIEQAERSLIEEQHEWFSVMRNLNV